VEKEVRQLSRWSPFGKLRVQVSSWSLHFGKLSVGAEATCDELFSKPFFIFF
jgi:hypothetical protein